MLQLGRQPDDVVGRPRPKHQTVALVLEAGLDVRTLQPQEGLVNGEAGEVGGEELVPLLGISPCTVRRVEQLDLGLQRRQVPLEEKGG